MVALGACKIGDLPLDVWRGGLGQKPAKVLRSRPKPDAWAARRDMEHLRLLCRCGAGLPAIAGPFCRLSRDIIGADSAALFWLGDDRKAAGFFHDKAPPELKDLFVTRFDELFGSPDQITMYDFINEGGASIGKTLADGFLERWLKGNIHRYLCVPLKHYHMLEMRIERHGQGCAGLFAWNPEERPFTKRDVALWSPVQALAEHAARADESQQVWRKVGEGLGHFITDISGRTLVAIDPEAESFLKDGHLLLQNVSMTGPVNDAPSFAWSLAEQLAVQATSSVTLSVANGRLVARATRTRTVRSGEVMPEMMHVALHREVATNVLAVEYLMNLSLTPFQREIALFAMTGGARSDCSAELGASDEALKKHLRPIFAATGATRWADLSALMP
jgi:hypothetical protein